MTEVIGFGAMNIDRVYRVLRLLTDGEAPIEEGVISPGGSAANTIYGLAKLGVKTGFVGAVGDDDEGNTLLSDFHSVGVDVSRVRIKRGTVTGSALCLTDKRGKRAIYLSPGANRLLTREDIDIEYLNGAKIIHLSSFIAEEQFELQRRILNDVSPSVMVSLAPGAIYAKKGWDALAPLITRASILFINQSEMRELTGEEFPKGAQRCLEQGCGIVAVTLGRGVGRRRPITCYLSNGHQEHSIEGWWGKGESVVDTTGAGDVFAAGFLYGFLRGKGLRECGFLGQIMSQLAIAEMGARSGLPTLSQLRQTYDELRGHSL